MIPARSRILIIEDDAVFGRALEQLAVSLGADSVLAADGEKAYQLALRERFDLIICDYRLPHKDGLAILTGLKEAGRQSPFVLVTAHYSDALEKAARDKGAAAVFEKPVELLSFFNCCQEVIRLTADNAQDLKSHSQRKAASVHFHGGSYEKSEDI